MIKFRVKDEPQPIDDIELIKLVKGHEFLYNTKNPDYRNLPQRSVIWSTIAQDLGINDRKF
jgi:Alcohol dehydrogenase transcription factor Myb/SANT-like